MQDVFQPKLANSSIGYFSRAIADATEKFYGREAGKVCVYAY
jgi:hypothetical protein